MFRTVSKLSQAAAHPRRGTNNTRNGISCKECPTCYTTKEEKAKEKNRAAFKDLDARNDASRVAFAGMISRSKNQTGLQDFHLIYFMHSYLLTNLPITSKKNWEGLNDLPTSGR
jgi:hypothetical protein